MMMLTLMLTSKGVAGVPRAALVVLTATLATFGLPLEGAAILLGIDQILDMGRTAVNVMGNCIATVVVARWEGVFDDEQMRRRSRRHDADEGGLMRIVVVGARGQLGRGGRARVRAAARRRRARRARRSISPTTRRSLSRDGARRARTSSSTARPTTPSTRPRIDPVDALAVNAFAVRVAGARGRTQRRRARALQHRLRLRRRSDAPYTEDGSPESAERLRGSRSCWASGSRATRRGTTCCASRACSADPDRKSSIDRIIEALAADREARVFTDRVVSPSFVDDVAAATQALLTLQAAPGAVSLRERRKRDVVRRRSPHRGRDASVTPRLAGVRVADVPMKAPRPQYCALSNAKLAAAGVRMPTWQDAIRRYIERTQ